MEGEYSIAVGDIVRINDKNFRVIYCSLQEIILCEMDIPTLNVFSLSVETVEGLLEKKLASIIKNTGAKVVVEDGISDSAKRDLRIRRGIVAKVNEEYGPKYLGLTGRQKKSVVEVCKEEFHIDGKYFWRTVRRYLQEGFSEHSLLNKPKGSKKRRFTGKPGRKGDYDNVTTFFAPSTDYIEPYEKALEWFKKGRFRSYSKAYEWMLSNYFSESVIENGALVKRVLPSVVVPSYQQFYYYCRQRITAEEYNKIKTSAREFFNNNRLLNGDAVWDSKHPGDRVQVDACEADVSLLSIVNFGQVIGRPIVYVMTDTLTRTVCAVSVGFENNSNLAWDDLMLNLDEDKEALLRRFGIEFNGDVNKVWPSHFVPDLILSDRGSDFKSTHTASVLNSLNIDRSLAPPATGSMKGIVEQWFHQMHSSMLLHLESHGAISKRYDSQHHKQATLTLTDFTKMLYIEVLSYNQKHMNDFNRDADLVNNGIRPIPCEMWEYLCRTKGSPRPIQNSVDYRFKFLSKATASLKREGIVMPYTKLVYLDPQNIDIELRRTALGKKSEKFPCWYDPRDISCIYYPDKDKNFRRADLNTNLHWQKSLGNCTVAEAKKYRRAVIQGDHDALDHNNQLGVDTFDAFESIVKDAVYDAKDIQRNTSNMREAREEEKQLVNRSHSLVESIEQEQQKEKALPEQKNKVEAPAASVPLTDESPDSSTSPESAVIVNREDGREDKGKSMEAKVKVSIAGENTSECPDNSNIPDKSNIPDNSDISDESRKEENGKDGKTGGGTEVKRKPKGPSPAERRAALYKALEEDW